MEKIQTNFKIFASIVITFNSLILIFLGYIKFIDFYQIPYVLLVTPYLMFIIYLADKKKKLGCYFSQEGILRKSRKKEFFTPWSEVKIKNKSLSKIEIQIAQNECILPFNILEQKSIITLTKKYCPENHELYKLVEVYAKEKNIPF